MIKHRYASIPREVVSTENPYLRVLQNMVILLWNTHTHLNINFNSLHFDQKNSLTLFGDFSFLDDGLSYWSEMESQGSFSFDFSGVVRY